MRRRDFLAVSGAALITSGCQRRENVWRWDGVVFGAAASVSLRDHDGGHLVEGWMDLVRRFDDVFSLWREDSTLSRLNRDGVLESAPQELIELIAWSRGFHERTKGKFDPTVEGYLQWKREPDDRTLEEVQRAVNFDHVMVDGEAVRLHEGAKMNFNAVVQGWLADRIANYLEGEGIQNALVNTGEWRALGGPWEVEAKGSVYSLKDRALAVSQTGVRSIRERGHIVFPVSGKSPQRNDAVTVLAPSGRVADGWATVAALVGVEEAKVLADAEITFV